MIGRRRGKVGGRSCPLGIVLTRSSRCCAKPNSTNPMASRIGVDRRHLRPSGQRPASCGLAPAGWDRHQAPVAAAARRAATRVETRLRRELCSGGRACRCGSPGAVRQTRAHDLAAVGRGAPAVRDIQRIPGAQRRRELPERPDAGHARPAGRLVAGGAGRGAPERLEYRSDRRDPAVAAPCAAKRRAAAR